MRVLKTAALTALDDQTVNTGLDGLHRGLQGRNDVEHRQARGLELLTIAGRVPRRGGHELDPLLNNEVDDLLVPHKGVGDIDPKRAVSQRLHLFDLFANCVELTR